MIDDSKKWDFMNENQGHHSIKMHLTIECFLVFLWSVTFSTSWSKQHPYPRHLTELCYIWCGYFGDGSASYQIRKTAGCACAGNAENVFPATEFKRNHQLAIPVCMSGSLTRGVGENVPGIPGACATRNFTYLVRGPCCANRTALKYRP